MRTIVVGNEKGGCGKSTVAAHLAIALLGLGYRVASIDIDSRQQTLSRFFANRAAYAAARSLALPSPDHAPLAPVDDGQPLPARLDSLARAYDVVVIDTPGADTPLARLAHGHADVLVTPVNDSFVDLDVLAEVDADSFAVARPSRYSAMVWEQKKARAARDRAGIDWVVMRNRLSHIDARNKRRVAAALEALAPRIGCRLIPGFAERVVFRELFPRGLTVLDLGLVKTPLTMSHVGARSELRGLLAAVLRGAAGDGTSGRVDADAGGRAAGGTGREARGG